MFDVEKDSYTEGFIARHSEPGGCVFEFELWINRNITGRWATVTVVSEPCQDPRYRKQIFWLSREGNADIVHSFRHGSPTDSDVRFSVNAEIDLDASPWIGDEIWNLVGWLFKSGRVEGVDVDGRGGQGIK